MKMRLKLLAAVALLGIPLAACEETTPPPPVGSIVGQVSIEGTGIDGVSVNLSNGNTTSTAGGGNFRFDNVEGGAYTITISGYPSDATFDATSAAATIASAGQSVTVNFTGSFIRTASVMGTVTVENMGLGGVTVALSGVSSASTVTDGNGQYAFTGLRMGGYSVEISGFDNDEIGFSNIAASVTVGTGESKIISFDGTYLRTAGIQGQVSVEGVGLEGVNVSVTGGPDGEDMSTMTDAAGLYSFAKLRAGDYAVGISGYDADEFEFTVTSQNVTIALGETANVPFEGILLRTSGIAGRVSVGGMGIADVTVTLSGAEDRTAMTDASGQYAVSGLAAGDYTVTISGYDAVEYSFTDSQDVTLAMDATAIVNFDGMSLRTAAVAVMVTADGEGVAGASASLIMVTGATSGTVAGAGVTGDDGGYTFGNLLAGAYRVDISVDSDEIEFADGTSWTGQVAIGMTAEATFAGTINRSAMISGMVTVDGAGMAGVMVTLSGGADDSMETGDDGSYSFSGLRKGDYTVSITNPDENRYEFGSTTESVNLAVGQSQSVSFAGSMVRSSSISGRVGLDDGTGVEGVTVTLSGAADDEATTDAGGLYTFTGLGAGDYTVAITLSDEAAAAYDFAEEETSKDQTLGDDNQETVNFTGSHKMTATVSGMLFVDEAAKNDSYDEGEHRLPAPGVPVVLVGPGVGQQTPRTTDETGAFMFSNLRAGTYQLVVAITPAVAMALGDYAYGGSATGYAINLGVGEDATQNLPFDITHQTVHFQTTLKNGDERGDLLPDAMVTLYSDIAGENKVGEGTTALDPYDSTVVTTIRFARAGTTGNTVYASVSSKDYHVDPDADMQAVGWDPKYTGTGAFNDANILNLNVDVSVSGATITTEAGGGEPLEDWAISIGHGDVMEADTLDEDGMTAFKMELPPAVVPLLPKTFTFSVDTAQANSLDGGQMFEATPFEYMHTGLALAGTVDAALEVKYTTQALRVWVHQEVDQVPGYTKTVAGGDSRPVARVNTEAPQKGLDAGISLELRYIDANGRTRPVPDYENRIRHPGQTTNATHVNNGSVLYNLVPTDLNIVVKASIDADRKIVNNDEAQAYRDFEANKVMGSAFGEHGGFHHTVTLCPETADDPDQDFETACSTFGYVWTRDISGAAMSQNVELDENPDDGFAVKTTNHSGIAVSLEPVARKNVQADNFGATTSAAAKTLGKYSIARVGDGNYTLSASAGWWDDANRTGAISYTTTEVAGTTTPPDSVTINIVPRTVDIYGIVTDKDGIEVGEAEVSVDGQTVTTDDYGRYILDDVAVGSDKRITVTKAGYRVDTPAPTAHSKANGYSVRLRNLWAHTPKEQDVVLESVAPTGTVTGTITHLQSGDAIEGVRVFALPAGATAPADLSKPGLLQNNVDTTFAEIDFADVDTTDASGQFTLDAPAGALRGYTTAIFAYRSGMFFTPDTHITTMVDGGEYSVNFQGLRLSAITGRVVYMVEGTPVPVTDVDVVASGGSTGGGITRTAKTNASGRYNIRVPWGPYEVDPDKDGHTFAPDSLSVTLGAEQIQTLQNFVATGEDVSVPKVTLVLSDDDIDEDGGISTVTATLSAAHNEVVTVTVSTTPASSDAFTVSPNKQLTIAANATTSTGLVTITAMDDDDTMADTVTVSGTTVPTTGVVAPVDVELTITDDDVPGGMVTLVLAPTVIDEAGSNNKSTVTATLSAPAPMAFEVTVLATAGMNAEADDFTQSGSTLFFAAGASSSTGSAVGDSVTITAVNNNEYEGDKKVVITGTVGGRVIAPAPQTLTIMDDDEPTVVSLVLSRPSIDEANDVTTDDVEENESVLTASVDRVHDVDLTVAVTIVGTGFAQSGGVSDDADDATEDTYTASLTITAGEMSSADGSASSVTITADPDDTDAMDHTVMISGAATPTAGVMQPQPVTLTIVDDDAAPSAPTALAADTVANTVVDRGTLDVTLTWTAPASLGSVDGTAVTATDVQYEYRTKTPGQSAWGAWTSITAAPGTGADVGKQMGTVDNAPVNNTHEYQVRARTSQDGLGGPASNTATVVIPAAPATE